MRTSGKLLLLFLLTLLMPALAHAQRENDILLLFGDPVGLDFRDPDTVKLYEDLNDSAVVASICDRDGNLALYAYGTGNELPDGPLIGYRPQEELHPDSFYIANGAGERLAGGPVKGTLNHACFLPAPETDQQEYYFFNFIEPKFDWIGYPGKLTYTRLRREPDGGRILEKNVVLIQGDTIPDPRSQALIGSLRLIRHANRTDWWLVAPDDRGGRFYTFLITKDGIAPRPAQVLEEMAIPSGWAGRHDHNLSFSADGSKFLVYHGCRNLNLYRFDRCSGMIQHDRWLERPRADVLGYCQEIPMPTYTAGILSPNGKYVYVSTRDSIYQIKVENRKKKLVFVNPNLFPSELHSTNVKFIRSNMSIYLLRSVEHCNARHLHRNQHSTSLGIIPMADSPYPDCDFKYFGLDLGEKMTWGLHAARLVDFDIPALTFADLPVVPKDALRRCPGGPPVELHPAGMRYENVSYRWEPAAGLDDPNAHNPNAAPETTTTYTLYLEGLQESCWPGDTLSRTVTVEVTPPPKLLTEPETTLCPGESVLLQADADTGWACRWEPAATLADPLACQTLARPQTATTYTLTAEHEQCGGFYQAEVAVEVKTCGLPPLPGAFSPNGDGINDRWPAFQHADFVSYSLKIYDRWGRELYSTQNPQAAWDGSANGTPAPEGVYFYRLDASTAEGAVVGKSGSLTVVR